MHGSHWLAGFDIQIHSARLNNIWHIANISTLPLLHTPLLCSTYTSLIHNHHNGSWPKAISTGNCQEDCQGAFKAQCQQECRCFGMSCRRVYNNSLLTFSTDIPRLCSLSTNVRVNLSHLPDDLQCSYTCPRWSDLRWCLGWWGRPVSTLSRPVNEEWVLRVSRKSQS